MLPLFGEERRRREINLGGTSSATPHAAILNQAKAQRNERESLRRQRESAVKLQGWWRGITESRRVKQELRSIFDQDPMGLTGLRCLVLIGRDEERLRRWSVTIMHGGEESLFILAEGPHKRSWLVLIRQIASMLLRSVSDAPQNPDRIPHLQVLNVLLSSAAVAQVIHADSSALCQNITAYLLKRDFYPLLASSICKIPPEAKSSQALPLLTVLCTAPLTTFVKNSAHYLDCISQIFHCILTIPVLPNRLPIPSIAFTQFSTQLPLTSFNLLSPHTTELVSSLPLQSRLNLLSNLVVFTPPRYKLLSATSLDAYLSLLSKLLGSVPANSFETPKPNRGPRTSSWADDSGDSETDDGPHVAGTSVFHRGQATSPPIDIDNKTRVRLQTLPAAPHLTALLNACSSHLVTRRSMYEFMLNLCTAWPARADKVLTAVTVSTSGRLAREIYREHVRGCPLGKNDDPRSLMDPAHAKAWPPLLFLTDLYTQSLLTMGDDEFFSGAATGTTAPRNPLTLDELTAFSRQLMNIAFTLYWHEDQTNVQEGCVSGSMIKWEAVREKVTKCLQAIHARDSRRPFAPLGHWLFTSQIDMVSFVEAAVFEEQEISQPLRPLSKRQIAYMSPRLGVLNNIPFAIPFEVRVTIFRHFVANDMMKHGGYDRFERRGRTRATVRRGNIATDGFDKLGNANLKGPVEITFIDQFGQEEAGIDGGGVFKEFFTSLCKEVFDSDRGLWLATKNNELYPNPHSYAKEAHSLEWYRFIGRILGKALYEGILIDVAFAGFFLAKWLGKQSFLDDLASLDPELYQGLLFLKRSSDNFEDLSLNFTVAEDEFGLAKTVDLIPNGSNIAVTRENRLQYIYLVCHYRLTKQIRPQSEAFFQGLSEMVDPKWLRMFNQQELQVLIGGANSPIDLEDLRRYTNYGGLYDDNEATIQMFWKVVNAFDHDQRRALLRFVTSCSRPPLLGFKELTPNFSIRDAGNDQHRLPTASTCVNLLKLPRYTSEQGLRQKLLQAIHSGAGFDLS